MSGQAAKRSGRPGHAWETWDTGTQRRMAEELVFHGAARAAWVRQYVEMDTDDKTTSMEGRDD